MSLNEVQKAADAQGLSYEPMAQPLRATIKLSDSLSLWTCKGRAYALFVEHEYDLESFGRLAMRLQDEFGVKPEMQVVSFVGPGPGFTTMIDANFSDGSERRLLKLWSWGDRSGFTETYTLPLGGAPEACSAPGPR